MYMTILNHMLGMRLEQWIEYLLAKKLVTSSCIKRCEEMSAISVRGLHEIHCLLVHQQSCHNVLAHWSTTCKNLKFKEFILVQ